MAFIVYRFLTGKITQFIAKKILNLRLKLGKETLDSIHQRQGHSNLSRPQGPLVWIHAASVGESLSVLNFIDHFIEFFPNFNILLTTGTLASAKILKFKLPQQVHHQFVPLDTISWVQRFLNHWQPNIAFWVESELWPNLIFETHLRHISLIMLNGQISNKSFKNWQWASRMVHILSECFKMSFTPSLENKQKLEKLGFSSIQVCKNLKFSSKSFKGNETEIKNFREKIGQRPVWMAVSTHYPEEEFVLEAHLALKKDFPDILTFLVIRHPNRANDLCETFSKKISISQRSLSQDLTLETDIYLVDTFGELGTFYPLSPICFVGGSLADIGGHNLIEPAHFNAALLHGPYMYKCEEVKNLFHSQEAAIEVKNVQDLITTLKTLLKSPELVQKQGQAAKKVVQSQNEVIGQILRSVCPLFENISKNYQENIKKDNFLSIQK